MSPDGDGCPAAPADTAGRTGWLDCGTTCPGRTAGGARAPETGTVVGTTRGWSWRYSRYSDDFGPGSASTRGHKSSHGHAGLRDGLKVWTAETCQRRSRTPRVRLIERAASSLQWSFQRALSTCQSNAACEISSWPLEWTSSQTLAKIFRRVLSEECPKPWCWRYSIMPRRRLVVLAPS